MESEKEILKNILISAETGCVLKIKLKDLPNPVITAVEKVSRKNIILKPTCLYGYIIPRRQIRLTEIENITRYHTFFNHPIFAKQRFIKNNISELRGNFGHVNGETKILKSGIH